MFENIPQPEPLVGGTKLRMHSFIDPSIGESDMSVLDNLFVKFKDKPEMYRLVTGPKAHRVCRYFLALPDGTEVNCDKRVICTWNNTFHLRYGKVMQSLGITTRTQFVSPEHQFLIAREMEMTGAMPDRLVDVTEVRVE